MKKIALTSAILLFAAFTVAVLAQDDKIIEKKIEKDKKETQEIIIRKKGEKDTKITVEIKGDKVTINGKPLSEFNDDEVTINKRNIIIRDGIRLNGLDLASEDFEGLRYLNEAKEQSRAFLGVTTEDVDEGAKIQSVSKGSAAEKAGLKEGDIITKVGDKTVDGPETLLEAVSSMKPKDEVKVYYKRDGKENSTNAILGERKESNALAYTFSGPDGMSRSYTIPRTPGIRAVPKVEMWNDKELGGMSPRIYTPGNGENFDFNYDMFPRQQKLGLKIQDTEDGKGVKVLAVDKDSPAEKAGLKKDDIVTEIGGNKVSNTDDVREQLHENQEKATYDIKATRNGNTINFEIKISKKLKTANL